MNVLLFSKIARFLNLFISTFLRDIETICFLSSSGRIIIKRSEATSKKKQQSSQRFRLVSDLYTLGALDKAAHIQLSFYTLIMMAQCNEALVDKFTRYIYPFISHLSFSKPLCIDCAMEDSIRSTYLITCGANVSRIC